MSIDQVINILRNSRISLGRNEILMDYAVAAYLSIYNNPKLNDSEVKAEINHEWIIGMESCDCYSIIESIRSLS